MRQITLDELNADRAHWDKERDAGPIEVLRDGEVLFTLQPRTRPCPYCQAPVAECGAELEPGSPERCGVWDCAHADHLRTVCPSPEAAEYRARAAKRKERYETKKAEMRAKRPLEIEPVGVCNWCGADGSITNSFCRSCDPELAAESDKLEWWNDL